MGKKPALNTKFRSLHYFRFSYLTNNELEMICKEEVVA
jgi:hypothetical protein